MEISYEDGMAYERLSEKEAEKIRIDQVKEKRDDNVNSNC